MRYDKNEMGHHFRNSDVPSDLSEIIKNTETSPKNNRAIGIIMTIVSLAFIVLPRVLKKLVVPGSVEAQLLLATGTFIFASAVMTMIPNPKATRRQQKNIKIAGVFVGIAGLVIGVITALKIQNKLNLNISEDDALLVIAAICGIAAVLCFVGGLISFIVSKTKYKVKGEAYCIGFDDKVGFDRSVSVVLSCPVYELEHDGSKYLIYDDRYDSGSRLPKIDDMVRVRYNVADPNDCVFGKVKRGLFPIFISFPLIVMCVAILLPILRDRNVIHIGSTTVSSQSETLDESYYYKKINKFMLDDKFLEEVLELDGEDHDFKIYVRVLDKVDGDKLVFEKQESIDDETNNHYTDAKEGEEYYWIERDDGLVLVLKKDSYVYSGNKLIG